MLNDVNIEFYASNYNHFITQKVTGLVG